MSSLKSGALLSLFSGFSFEGVQRAHQGSNARVSDAMPYDHYPVHSATLALASAAPEVTAVSLVKQAA
jgi:hypothetical protein